MRIFLTGATGFIGSHLIPELIGAGHQVIGVTRSDAGAAALAKAGVEPYRGTLEAPDGLLAGAATADAVIHTAFDHDFSRFVANCEKDRHVIAALGAALKGSDRPLLITSGTGIGSSGPGQLAREDVMAADHPNPRIASEQAGAALLADGINVSVMRLPQVHDTRKQGLISPAIDIARAQGISAYVGDGHNRWPAAAVADVAQLYRLAIEAAEPGARYHAVAEEGITVRAVATAIGRGLGIPTVSLSPDEAAAHFGWMAAFVAMDMPASSAITRERLGWRPTGPGLIANLETADYATVGWASPAA
ncbi:SDR family oxidoreductase [Lichenihabitans sp. Uapishka_5]|uniref:SDR family oxidoreductase n=1 Tax=Lichenihabitans sp. Uapishka_5 TaxID=3037302 RepID=UPI0029E81757|nr:SDR family oxidoreductase [Lichenihabitans sp. Uapishka_5]MDX7952030.1 SDR family oxidoreductase [Lichenihabitans sp. Uapishka_5]